MKVHVDVPMVVDLDYETMKRVSVEVIRRVFDIPRDGFIEDGELLEHYDTHGSGYDEHIRSATEDDVMALSVIKRIQESRS